jgi:MFS family permease
MRSPARVGLLFGGLLAPTALGISAPAVALPELARDLGLPSSQTAWVLAAYALALAIGTALSGQFGAVRGLRQTLIVGVLLVAVGSAIAAASPVFGLLVLGRSVQGAGAGAVTIAAMGTISTTFSSADASRALGSLTAVVAGVSGAGSLIGGALTDALGWRAVVALPTLSLLFLPAALGLAPSQPSAERSIDGRGALLVTIVAASFVGLLQSRSTGLGATVVAGLVVVVVTGAVLLARHARVRPDGFLPDALVRNGPFLRHALVGFTLFAAYLAMLFAAPLMLASRFGWGPLTIGLVLLPAAVCAVATSRVVPLVLPRAGTARVAMTLTLLSAAGLLVAGASQTRVATVVGLAAAVSGFAGAQVALVGAVPALVPAELRTSAVAVFNLVFIAGGSVGSAAAGGLADAFSLPVAVAAVAVLPVAGALIARTLPSVRHAPFLPPKAATGR